MHTTRIATSLGATDIWHLRRFIIEGVVTPANLIISIKVASKSKQGQHTLLTQDEEAICVATSEIQGAHALPIRRKGLALKLHTALEIVGGQDAGSPMKLNSKLKNLRHYITYSSQQIPLFI